MFIGSPFVWDNRPPINLLNTSMIELGSLVPMGGNLICNNARLISLLVLRHFYCAFNKFYAWLYLTTALVEIERCYCLLYAHLAVKLSEHF